MRSGGTTYDPERLYAAIDRIRQTCFDAAVQWAGEAEARMRSEADWTDRNGPSRTGLNARESLSAETHEDADGNIVVTLYSTRQTLRPWKDWRSGAPLGMFLEEGTRGRAGTGVGAMRAHPVIWPTARSMAPTLKSRVQKLLTES